MQKLNRLYSLFAISGDMVLVGESTNKVVAYKVFSRSCSLCIQKGNGGHEGACNNNYSGTAKSMEPRGMVECLKDLNSRGGHVTELIVDNDGNTMEAVQVIRCRRSSLLYHKKPRLVNNNIHFSNEYKV